MSKISKIIERETRKLERQREAVADTEAHVQLLLSVDESPSTPSPVKK